jgi:hypothetical protein
MSSDPIFAIIREIVVPEKKLVTYTETLRNAMNFIDHQET